MGLFGNSNTNSFLNAAGSSFLEKKDQEDDDSDGEDPELESG